MPIDTAMSGCPKNAQVRRKTLALAPQKFSATQRDLTVQKKTIHVANGLLSWVLSCQKNRIDLNCFARRLRQVGSHLPPIGDELTSVLAFTFHRRSAAFALGTVIALAERALSLFTSGGLLGWWRNNPVLIRQKENDLLAKLANMLRTEERRSERERDHELIATINRTMKDLKRQRKERRQRGRDSP